VTFIILTKHFGSFQISRIDKVLMITRDLILHEPRNKYVFTNYPALEKCSITRETREGGFTPAAVAPPPDAITPEQVLHHHRSAQGSMGDRLMSPPAFVPAS